MVEVIKIHRRSIVTQINSLARWSIPGSTRLEIHKFVEELALGKVNRGRKISETRQVKLLDLLKVPLVFFHKPTAELTERDIEAFERALSTDVVHSKHEERPYAMATKVDIRKALKIFLRWRLGPAKALELAGWLDTRNRFKTPDFLKEADVQALFAKCRTVEQRYAIAVLFDSGARAGEFLNLRFEDIHLPEGKEEFVKTTLKEEYSKTKGRTISLYWRHSLDAVKAYLHERIAQGIKPQEPVFLNTYDSMRMFLARLGRKVLKRAVHPHLFRHSSATYYATQMNRQELCYRYGWRFSSNMPDVYISRAGMETKDLDKKITHTQLTGLKDDLVQLKMELAMKGDRLKKIETELAAVRRQFPLISRLSKRCRQLNS